MTVGLVTGNYFNVMGLSAVAGRLLTDGDDGVNVAAGHGAHARVLDEALRRRSRRSSASTVGSAASRCKSSASLQPAPYFPRPMDALLNMVMSEHHTERDDGARAARIA